MIGKYLLVSYFLRQLIENLRYVTRFQKENNAPGLLSESYRCPYFFGWQFDLISPHQEGKRDPNIEKTVNGIKRYFFSFLHS